MEANLSNTVQTIAAEAQEKLSELARKANEAHLAAQSAAATAVEQALESGRALLEAKDLCRHRTWLKWLAEHFRGGRGTAQAYMRAAKRWHLLVAKVPNATQLPLRHVLKLISNVVPHGSDEFVEVPTPVAEPSPMDETVARPRYGADQPASDEVEMVRMVVNLFNGLVEALCRLMRGAAGDIADYQVLLSDLKRLRPQIDDFEESIRYQSRRQ